MVIALLFLILFAILFPKALRFLFALLFLGGIMVLGEVHANDKTCEKAAAFQVAGEPGIHECLSHRNMSADCVAVLQASMNKRIHECHEAHQMLRTEE
jgi:hypothetical protein